MLHPRTCTDSGASVAAFLSTCHLIYSYGYDSVAEALQTLRDPPPRPGDRSLTDYLPGYNPFLGRRRK